MNVPTTDGWASEEFVRTADRTFGTEVPRRCLGLTNPPIGCRTRYVAIPLDLQITQCSRNTSIIDLQNAVCQSFQTIWLVVRYGFQNLTKL